MKNNISNIANFKNVDDFVEYKTSLLQNGEHSFDALFQLMFSEKNNVMWEENNGYKIIKKTYKEVYDNILALADLLEVKLSKYQKNSVIGLYMQNNLSWIEFFWAILKCGFKPFLLNTRMNINILNNLLSDAKATVVISDDLKFDLPTLFSNDILAQMSKNANTTDEEYNIANVTKQTNKENTKSDENAEVNINKQTTDTLNSTKFGDEILLMTSGTQSKAKICVYGAEEIICQILNAKSVVKTNKLVKKHYNGELKLLTFLPFYHIFGLTAVYLWFAFFSRTFVYLKDMSPACILNTIHRHNVTHIFAVPLFWEKVHTEALKKIRERGEKTVKKFYTGLRLSLKLSNAPKLADAFRKKAFKEVRDKLFGESVVFTITGGGSIKKETLEFFNGIGYNLANGYGMTEIGISSVELSTNANVLCSGSVGLPLDTIEYKIDDDSRLLVKGSTMCKYYIENGQMFVTSEDWFDTKDLAKFENNRYFILGRSDDVIVTSNGENLNPNLYENKLCVNGVKGTCIIDAKKNNEVYPILLLSVNKFTTPSKQASILSDVKSLLSQMGIIADIKEILFIGEDLIKDNEFKLDRKRIKSDYLGGKLNILSDNADNNTNNNIDSDYIDKIEQKIAECFFKALNKKIDKNANFFVDGGGTSLDFFTLINELQNEFDIVIELTAVKELFTINDFYNYIKEMLR